MYTSNAEIQQLRAANAGLMQDNQQLRQENVNAQDEILRVQHEDEAIRADAQAKINECNAKQLAFSQEKEQVDASLAAAIRQIDSLTLNQRTPNDISEAQAMSQQLALLRQQVEENEGRSFMFAQERSEWVTTRAQLGNEFAASRNTWNIIMANLTNEKELIAIKHAEEIQTPKNEQQLLRDEITTNRYMSRDGIGTGGQPPGGICALCNVKQLKITEQDVSIAAKDKQIKELHADVYSYS